MTPSERRRAMVGCVCDPKLRDQFYKRLADGDDDGVLVDLRVLAVNHQLNGYDFLFPEFLHN